MFTALRRIGAPLTLVATMLAGCVAGPEPTNRPGAIWMPQQGPARAIACTAAPQSLPPMPVAPLTVRSPVVNALAPGDRVRLRLLGDADRITGTYVLAQDGSVSVPGLAPAPLAGLSPSQAEAVLSQMLVTNGIARASERPLRLIVIERAPVSVAVSGAVYEAGTVRVGERSADTRIGQKEGESSGDANFGRSLAAALRAAGGVRPDADVTRVGLVRGDRISVVSMATIAQGGGGDDVPLQAGDRIIVPSSGCFHAELVRPTAITAPGIRVYMSNLSRPAANNGSSAIGKETTSLPYGTRFLQSLVAANCVGGSAMNAGRRAVLISRSPITGQSVVIERAVETLVRNAGRDDLDPYLMPYDAIACYDSRWMNASDAIGLVGNALGGLTPALLLRNAVNGK